MAGTSPAMTVLDGDAWPRVSWRECHKTAENRRAGHAADFLGAETGLNKG